MANSICKHIGKPTHANTQTKGLPKSLKSHPD